jgi:hypothetical protein
MTASPTTAAVQASYVVVTCSCGLFPLDKASHATSGAAWQAAAAHVALNPTKCHPQMSRDLAPAGLVAAMAATR